MRHLTIRSRRRRRRRCLAQPACLLARLRQLPPLRLQVVSRTLEIVLQGGVRLTQGAVR